MLYDRWRQVAREFPHQLALRDLPTGRSWTFSQLDDAAQAPPRDTGFIVVRGSAAEFVIDVLRAWRHNRVVCPLEPGQPLPVFPQPPTEIVHLKCTSATTGAPKLVLFTAAQLAADAANIVQTMGLRRDWPNLAFISLAHSYGFSNLVTPLLLHGIPLIIGGHPLPETMRKAAEAESAVTVAAVPALWRVWSDARAIALSVRLAISAGAPLPLAVEQEVFAAAGLKIHNFYGATECGGIAYDSSDRPRLDGSFVGEAMSGVTLAVNSSGCMEVRGANVGQGYWPDPDPGLAGGIYRTSDLAGLINGQVWLRGRATDVMNVAGRKLAPETVERLLAAHPHVRDCLVFGVPSRDAQRGDTIVACVATRNGTTPDALRSYLLERSEAWQVPREFWLVPSLEANSRGKLPRAEWRARFLERRESMEPP